MHIRESISNPLKLNPYIWFVLASQNTHKLQSFWLGPTDPKHLIRGPAFYLNQNIVQHLLRVSLRDFEHTPVSLFPSRPHKWGETNLWDGNIARCTLITVQEKGCHLGDNRTALHRSLSKSSCNSVRDHCTRTIDKKVGTVSLRHCWNKGHMKGQKSQFLKQDVSWFNRFWIAIRVQIECLPILPSKQTRRLQGKTIDKNSRRLNCRSHASPQIPISNPNNFILKIYCWNWTWSNQVEYIHCLLGTSTREIPISMRTELTHPWGLSLDQGHKRLSPYLSLSLPPGSQGSSQKLVLLSVPILYDEFLTKLKLG